MRWPTKSLPELRASKGVTHVSLLSFQEAKFFPQTRESLRGLVSSLVDGFLGSLGNLVHGWGRKERSVEGGTLGNHSHARLASTGAPSPEAMRTEGLQRRQCWVEYGGVQRGRDEDGRRSGKGHGPSLEDPGHLLSLSHSAQG